MDTSLLYDPFATRIILYFILMAVSAISAVGFITGVLGFISARLSYSAYMSARIQETVAYVEPEIIKTLASQVIASKPAARKAVFWGMCSFVCLIVGVL